MKKRNYISIIILLFLIFGGVKFLLIESNNDPIVLEEVSGEIVQNLESIPKIDWEMLYQYNYKTGKGPKSLLSLHGKLVKIPGFIVPLSDDYTELTEFLVVPDAQACVHVPPPPPNLILAAKLRKSVPINEVSNPSWIIGIFKIEKSESKHGGSAYKIDAIKLEEFDFDEYD